MRTIAVLNQKGGVGKTTTVANTAAALAAAGSQVVAIDLDPQAHLTIHLGLEPQIVEAGSYKVLTQSAQFEEQIMLVRPNLWLLPANINLVGAESELVSVVGRETILREALESSNDKFDYCLIDCAPSLGLLTLNALAAAEEVLIPLQPHFLALQGFGQLLQTVDLVNKRINPNLKVKGILLCMFDSRASLPNEVRTDIEQFLNNARGSNNAWSEAQILPTFIRRNIKLAEAPSYGKTIFEYEPNCHGSEDYQKVAQFVHAQFQPPAQTEMSHTATVDEINDENEHDFSEPPAPEIQPFESDENPDEPLAATEPVSQPDPQPESETPPQSTAGPDGDDQGQSKPPFEIKSIPQSEPHTPTEFTPSNKDPNQHETGYGEY
ncbi:MAG: AAA family ATPase [Sedimentisphaerales bacterium]|nr:AAA family ATPase [Sedimentisphaerales bacterium]